MYCSKCGKEIINATNYCLHCGHVLSKKEQASPVLYHLSRTANRFCDIQLYSDHVTFSGKFWYLHDKDFYKNHGKTETALIKDFLGMGYLEKRSYRQTILFVFIGSVLELTKAVVGKLCQWVDIANEYLQWINHTIVIPEWMNLTINILAFICIILGIVLLFSKKKVIEISFTTKRICIPQKSLSANEFQTLCTIIKSQKL